MTTLDLSPLYRSTIGFDRLASLLDHTLSAKSTTPTYPPYNIEVLDENRYAITLAVAGFDNSEMDINVESGVLTVRGKKVSADDREYLHQGIANRSFERKFNLADYVEVTGADLRNGLLSIQLKKEIPEAMKPKTIVINSAEQSSEKHLEDKSQDANQAA